MSLELGAQHTRQRDLADVAKHDDWTRLNLNRVRDVVLAPNVEDDAITHPEVTLLQPL
jgi:hypothetical protein